MDDLQVLRARGAPAELLATIAGSGLPAAAARGAVERAGRFNRLRRWLRPEAALSESELERLKAVAALAAEIAADEGGAEGAARFWNAEMPWLDGRTPAYWMSRGDIGAIEDLRVRINYGIPP